MRQTSRTTGVGAGMTGELEAMAKSGEEELWGKCVSNNLCLTFVRGTFRLVTRVPVPCPATETPTSGHCTTQCFAAAHVRAINGIINPYLQNSDSEKRQRGLADCAFQNTGHSTVEGYGLLAFVLLKT